MDTESIKMFMGIVQKYSPRYFINHNFELIIEPKNNIYFRLEDVKNELDLKCKVLSWLSRPSCKGVSDYWQKRIRSIVNEFLGTDFTLDDMVEIYTYLGNDCNRNKTIRFIESNYDFNVLTTYYDDTISGKELITDESEFENIGYAHRSLFKTKELAQKFCDYKNNENIEVSKNAIGKRQDVKQVHCYDPDEQVFQVEDKLIAIDWGKNGDKAIKVISRIEKDGTITVLGFEELNK